jgi:hypothetical protein
VSERGEDARGAEQRPQQTHVRRVGALVVRQRLAPLLPVRPVVAHARVGQREHLVLAARVHRLPQHALPVADAHAQLDREVPPVHARVDLLRFVEPPEVRRHLGALLGLVVQHLQALDELDALRGAGNGRGRRETEGAQARVSDVWRVQRRRRV